MLSLINPLSLKGLKLHKIVYGGVLCEFLEAFYAHKEEEEAMISDTQSHRCETEY